MSEEKKGFIGKIIGTLRSPKKTFEDIEETDLTRGIAVVILVALLTAWAGMIYFSKIPMDFSALAGQGGMGGNSPMFQPGAQDSGGFDPEAMRSRLAPFVAIGNGLGAITRWLVPSVILMMVANLRVGKGNTRRLLAMTGFASAPRILQQTLRVIDAYTISTADIASVAATRSLFRGLVGKILNQTLGVFNLFGILAMILTVHAVSVNYETTTRKSITVTILAYSIYVLIRTYLPIL